MHGLTAINIVPHSLAREVRDEWKVERHPTPKRRKQWRVVKHYIDRPGCYQAGGTLYMHPELVEKLRQATILSNAAVQADSAGGVSPGALGSAATTENWNGDE